MKGGGRSYTSYTKPIGSSFGSNDDKDCSSIDFTTELQNIKAGINKVAVKDVLSITLEAGGALAAYNKDNEVCGYIVSPKMNKIANCIRMGIEYIAIVLKKEKKICEVWVKIHK